MFRVLLVDDEAPFVENMLAFDWAKNNCECVASRIMAKKRCVWRE